MGYLLPHHSIGFCCIISSLQTYTLSVASTVRHIHLHPNFIKLFQTFLCQRPLVCSVSVWKSILEAVFHQVLILLIIVCLILFILIYESLAKFLASPSYHYLVIVDDFSKVSCIFLMKEQANVLCILKNFILETKTQFSFTMNNARTDNTLELKSSIFYLCFLQSMASILNYLFSYFEAKWDC